MPRLRARGAASRMRRIGRATASGAAACVTLIGVVIVIANVQGAFAPLSSVLSFLPQVSGTEVAVAACAVRLDVSAASLAPSTSALVHDFAVYHAVLAVAATCLVVAALVMAVQLWRSRHRWDSDSRDRRAGGRIRADCCNLGHTARARDIGSEMFESEEQGGPSWSGN